MQSVDLICETNRQTRLLRNRDTLQVLRQRKVLAAKRCRFAGTRADITGENMVDAPDSADWLDREVREWLLLLLRFAVTRAPADRVAARTMAEELDCLGLRWKPTGPRFFRRTTNEVCAAVLAAGDVHSAAVLRRHINRIDDQRLKRAFQAAVGLEPHLLPHSQDTQAAAGKRRRDLWAGLPEK